MRASAAAIACGYTAVPSLPYLVVPLSFSTLHCPSLLYEEFLSKRNQRDDQPCLIHPRAISSVAEDSVGHFGVGSAPDETLSFCCTPLYLQQVCQSRWRESVSKITVFVGG